MIDDYRFIKELGRGGDGIVYLAEHRYLKTLVAVKMLRQPITPVQEARFRREARIAAQFNHSGILRVRDFGIEHGTPYLIMDYAKYGSLRTLHPAGQPLPRDLLLDYAWQVAEALDYLQQQDCIHRDVKPENLLIGEQGQIVLSDFGIALTMREGWHLRDQESRGTPAYMSPEQIMGRPGEASDQYSLGVIVYEWVGGELPFNGKSRDIARQHLSQRPLSLRARVRNFPVAAEQVIMKALSKNPRARFASAGEFIAALEDTWQEPPSVRSRVNFSAQPTHQEEIPVVEPPEHRRQGKKSSRRHLKAQRPARHWGRIASVFSIDLLLGYLLLRSPLVLPVAWLVDATGLVGLPLLIGLLKMDTYLLRLLGANVVFALFCGVIFQTVSASLDAYLIGAVVSLLLALSLSFHHR